MLPDYLANEDGLPRVITREQALARGISRHAIEHRLRMRRWRRILPSTYLTGSTLTWPDRLGAALLFAGTPAVLTGAAALSDQGLRCVSRPDRVLVLVPEENDRRPAEWVRLRRTGRFPQRSLVPGPARADLPRAVADLALELRRLDDVRTLVAQAKRKNLCTVAELAAELEAGPQQGSAHLRRAILEVDAGSWSAPEAHAADLLRRANVPPFQQNAEVRLREGGHLTVDFWWKKLRAVLEIDSDEHHWDDTVDRDATLDRQTVLHGNAQTTMSRRPGAIRLHPAKFQRDAEHWLRAAPLNSDCPSGDQHPSEPSPTGSRGC